MPYHVYQSILDHLIMNKNEYQEIYNYLEALHIPKDYDEHRITHLKNKSSKYFIQHHQLFRRRKQGQPQRVILPDQVEIILFNLHKDQMELILESKQPSKRPKKDTIGHKCMKPLDNML